MNIATDKVAHVGAGACWAAGTQIVALAVGIEPSVAAAAGVAASAVVGVLREVHNRRRGGRFDPLDIAATVAGGAVAVAGNVFTILR